MTTKNGCTKAETMTAAAMAAKLISTTSLCFQAGQTYATANEIELFELVASALATIAVIGAQTRATPDQSLKAFGLDVAGNGGT